MGDSSQDRGRLRRIALEILGWLLLVVGVAALVLPGPGLLMMVAGLAILSQTYEWAERQLEPVKVKAFETAEAGVKTWPRIIASTAGGLVIIVLGVLWILQPEIPEVWIFGPQLPFAGWGTGSTMILSGLIVLGLMVYSIRRFRHSPQADAEHAH
jgi:uncharacterized protein (TIGR02611 family)